MRNDDHKPTAAELAEAKELAERLQKLVGRSQKVWAQSLERSLHDITTLKPDPLNTAPAMAKLAYDYIDHPQKFIEASMAFWAGHADLWSRTWARAFGEEKVQPVVEPSRSDKRFKDEIWEQNPFFDHLKQSYLLTANWLKDSLEKAEGLSPQERKKLDLVVRNFIEAHAPSNYPGLNPEVLKATVDQKGENLLRGLEHMIRDMERGKGVLMIRQTDMDAFEVGKNMATTPGKVVFQNDVMQLIQYSPSTETVRKRPLLFIPPWINKFYILDLNEKKSMIRWLVGQGYTVFVISWINPDERQKDETWGSYMAKGPLTAITKALEETGADKVNIVGYCIGGTMLGTTLAYMAQNDDNRVASATFFTAQLDFTDAGELQAFVDDEVIDTIEGAVGECGYLAAENMAGAFNSLRSTDLIWSFVINNYFLGKENFPFDLLYWNSDSTAMPGRVHVFYLDQFYNRNALAKGAIEIDGVKLDLAKVKVPSYHVATIEDHIAPAASAYRGARLLGGRSQTYVLTGSGHIAGVVNPPEPQKYQFWTKAGMKADSLEEWREGTTETPGSWWPHWDAWLKKHSGPNVPPRQPGAKLGVIEDAPGSYVKIRADQR
ncbi:class I poly(R)-hydroxyalkanoic acid synthase [Limibaculum sp. M0105]|uniref:Class I poly(R)-hydroxyalkanoic acid synthase n=1 Tax=Thermohalobaculum xanthum TaxID=2753746 RepID=A0A8J7SF46_9RHOB|nr:class I poly(R)-hydroxyalkanoic acid synthase [Thermohalobaculum xanthum]MBK0399327.1 class I poly(R)-hydroxyalkanoic acid synthase [Thermohalobaculum xanthum]